MKVSYLFRQYISSKIEENSHERMGNFENISPQCDRFILYLFVLRSRAERPQQQKTAIKSYCNFPVQDLRNFFALGRLGCFVHLDDFKEGMQLT